MLHVETALPADFGPIKVLLDAAGLPTSDLESAPPEFVVLREDGKVIAAGALERYGSVALLRSVVVAERARGRGFGQRVVRELERVARGQKIEQLVLLTQTANEFFRRAGYRTIERAAAPLAVHESAEFRSLCPSSATCMAKTLAAEN